MPGHPSLGETLSRYRVETAGGEPVGFLVEVEFHSGGDRRFVVLNSFGQEMGFLDANGQAFRYRSSDGEPGHVGTGTMVDGVRAVLRLEGPVFLVSEK